MKYQVHIIDTFNDEPELINFPLEVKGEIPVPYNFEIALHQSEDFGTTNFSVKYIDLTNLEDHRGIPFVIYDVEHDVNLAGILLPQ